VKTRQRRAAAGSSSRSATRGRATDRIDRSNSGRSFPTEFFRSSTRSFARSGATSDRRSTEWSFTLAAPGDTGVDLKWRFFERDKLSLAVRAGVNAPTGDADRGLGSGKPTYHGILVASIDLAPIALHTNIGYTGNRANPTERRDLYHVSAAAVWTLDPTWRLLLAELAGDTNVDSTRSVWPAVARIGAIYTVKKRLRHRHRLPDTSQPRGGEPDAADRAHCALGALMIDAAPGCVL
jgi:hypothetical protein